MATLDVKQTGGTYSTLNAALAAATASDTISIEGSWTIDDTTACTVADDNIIIQTDASSKHPGYWDESQNHYRLVVSSGHALTINGAYTVTVDGLAIEQAGTTVSDECIRCVPGTSDVVTIKNCLIHVSGGAQQQDCIYTGYNVSAGTINLENCIMYGADRAGIHSQNAFSSAGQSVTINVNSCTVWNNGLDNSPVNPAYIGGGILVSGDISNAYSLANISVNVHNTICVENDTGSQSGGVYPHDFNVVRNAGSTPPVWGISYSIDSDNTIATYDSGGSGNLASRTATDNTSPGTGDWVIFEDITSSPYDLRIVDNAENDAQDAHTTATAEGLTIPSTDIVGTSRPQNTNYDIGAFEIVFSSSTDNLSVSDLTSGTPTIDTITISQIHSLIAVEVSTTVTLDTTTILEAVFLRPISDITVGSWTPSEGATLYGVVDEASPNDDDYMRSEDNPSGSLAEVGLSSSSDPQTSDFHIIRYRYLKNGTGTLQLVFYLMEGTTQIATWQDVNAPGTPTTGSYQLSVSEANSITNYANLRIRMVATEL